jgi:hypothetical protein
MLWTIAKVTGLAALLTLVAVTSPWWMTLCVSSGLLTVLNMNSDEDEDDEE